MLILSSRSPAIVALPAAQLVVPLVDGTRTANDIARAVAAELSAEEVDAVLAELRSCAAIVPAMDEHGETPIGTASVHPLGTASAQQLIDALRDLDVEVVDQGGALDIVVCDDYLRPELAEVNARAIEDGHAWMLVRVAPGAAWLGPLFHPDRTGCWDCLAQRLREHRPIEGYLDELRGETESAVEPASPDAATSMTVCGLAAAAVVRWLSEGQHTDLEGRVITIDLSTGATTSHELIWRPQCPACGAPDGSRDRLPDPIALESTRKAFVNDGGHRAMPPEQTIQRLLRHVSPVTGILATLEPMGWPGTPLHVYRAGADADTARVLYALGARYASGSSGKGATDIQARASGLCEAIERYSAVFRGDEPRRTTSMADLGAHAIHPNDCMRFSDHQYAHRDETNRRAPNRRLFVPKPFDPEAQIEWTPVWSLTREQVRWLPTAWCFFAYPESPSDVTCIGCSNGNAAGNTFEEAMLQGFLELVERDAVACWWYNGLSRPSVDVDAFGEPYVEDLVAYVRTAGRDLWVVDITSDLGIPVFVAVSGAGDRGGEDVVLGFGAHLDARIALLRAVTEVNQKLVTVIRHPALLAVPPRPTDTEVEWGSEVLDVRELPHLAPSKEARPTVPADRAWPYTDDIRDDLLTCKGLVEERGMELLVLDQTRPDIGLPVVKVIVPGLRHFWRRFAPGRLYDVPVTMGWLSEPRPEQDLCSIPPPS